MTSDFKLPEKRPISWDDVGQVEGIDAYKKIEIVDGDWHLPDEIFYQKTRSRPLALAMGM